MFSLLLSSNTLNRTPRALSVCSQCANDTTTDTIQLSSWLSKLNESRPTRSKHHNSSDSTSRKNYPVSLRTLEAEEQNVKTKTETRIITEDCSSTDDMERTTIVEMVPSTRVVEYVPSYTETQTITVLYDVTKTASSTRSRTPKHTKHTWTEIVNTSSPTTSKKHTRSSKTTGSSSPSSSASSSSKKEVVVTTSEVVEVVTVGYTEVTSTMTLTEGDSRLSSTTQSTSTASSSAAYSIDRPSYPTWLTKPWPPILTYSADAVVGDVNVISTPKTTPLSTSFRTIYSIATSKTQPTLDGFNHITTPAIAPTTKTQGSDDIVENLSARDDDDDPDHFSKKYLKPDKAMSKRMSRWSRHYSILMEKQSSHKQDAWIRSYDKSIKSADKASKKKHYDHDDEQFASAGLLARDDAVMTAPATPRAMVTVTTTILPTQNQTYSISIRTIYASKTGSAKNATISISSKTHSKYAHKASSKASKTFSGTSSKTTSPSALKMDALAMTTSKYVPIVCTHILCPLGNEGQAPTKTTLEAEDAAMSTIVSQEESAHPLKFDCMNFKCRSKYYPRVMASTVKVSPSKVSSTSINEQDAAKSSL